MTFDVFKVHRVEDVETVLEENNVVSVIVPSNCTDRLQPLDLTGEYRYSSWKKTASEEQWNLFCHLANTGTHLGKKQLLKNNGTYSATFTVLILHKARNINLPLLLLEQPADIH